MRKSSPRPNGAVTGRDRLIYERALEAARSSGLDLDILAKDAAAAHAVIGTASLLDAAKLYAEHTIKIVPKTVAEVVAELVADREKNGRSPEYLRDLRNRLGNLAEAFQCPMSSLEWREIELYLDKIGATGRYRRNLLDGYGMLFNFARQRGYVHRDHKGVEPITRPTTVPREIRVFAPDECRKLLLGLPVSMIPAAAIGCFTAIRSAEIQRMDWSQVDLRQRHIKIMARIAKKKVRRIVPIPPNLKQWLLPFAQSPGKVCPFSRLSNQWNKFAERAGVKWTRNVHRDSGISYAVASKRNVAEVALDSGNSPAVIMSNYLKAVTEAEAKKWFAIAPPKDWKPLTDLGRVPVGQATSMESQDRKVVEKAA